MAGIVAEAEPAAGVSVTVHDERLRDELQRWSNDKKKPLVLVAVGRGGAGKSTLVNNLLELKEGDEQFCPEGDLASAETTTVELCIKHYKLNKDTSVEVRIADTPGLGVGVSVENIGPETVITNLSKITEKKADVLFYCVSLHPSAKPCNTDVKIVKLLTAAYGAEIWERAFLILTFANQCKQQDYVAKIKSYASMFAEILKKANVTIPVKAVLPAEARLEHEVADETQQPETQPPETQPPEHIYIPAIPVGNRDPDPILQYPVKHNWSENLFIEVLKKASDPHTLSNLLALRGFEIKLEEVVGGAIGGGAIVGGAVGGAAGAAAGLGLGVIIGGPVGAVAGAVVGAALAVAKAKLLKFQATRF